MSGSTDFYDTVPVNEQSLKSDYLFGLPLEDEDGNQFPSSMYRTASRYAIAYMERLLGGVCIVPTPFTNEEHDYIHDNYKNWAYFQPDHIPILSVERVAAEFPSGQEAVRFPAEWISFDPMRHIQIIPRSGSLATVFLGQGQILLPLVQGILGYVPHLIHIDYTAGFAVGEIPPDILHAISLLAAIQILHPAGDLIIGPGIANEEIRVNRLWQKLETTASPTNAGFGARILNYKNELKTLVEMLRRDYHGVPLAVA